jgi:hypothetical protein
LFEISATPGTEVDSDVSFAGIWRLLALLPELQQGEKSVSPPPSEKSAKSIFMQNTRTVRFKFLTTPNSFHGRDFIAKTCQAPDFAGNPVKFRLALEFTDCPSAWHHGALS